MAEGTAGPCRHSRSDPLRRFPGRKRRQHPEDDHAGGDDMHEREDHRLLARRARHGRDVGEVWDHREEDEDYRGDDREDSRRRRR